MSSNVANRRQICETIVSACGPYQYPEPWQTLAPHRDVLRLPEDATVVLAALRKRWSDKRLRAAGVIESDDDGTLRLIPKLNTPGQLVLVRRDPVGVVMDLLTETGHLFAADLPVLTALAESPFRWSPDHPPMVLAAFSLADLAVLQALGIPSTLATGLDQITPQCLPEFCTAFGIRSRVVSFNSEAIELRDDAASSLTADEPSDIAATQDAPVLILVGWSPAAPDTEAPAGLSAVARLFQDFDKYLDLDFSELSYWKVSVDLLEHLNFKIRYLQTELVRDALLNSLDNDCFTLNSFGKVAPLRRQMPDDLPTALAVLHELLHSDPASDMSPNESAKLRSEAFRRVLRLLHAEVVRPLIEQALQLPQPSQKALAFVAAQQLELILTQSLVLTTRINKRLLNTRVDRLNPKLLNQIPVLVKTVDAYLRTFRELDRCREPSNQLIPGLATPRLSLRSWTGSN